MATLPFGVQVPDQPQQQAPPQASGQPPGDYSGFIKQVLMELYQEVHAQAPQPPLAPNPQPLDTWSAAAAAHNPNLLPFLQARANAPGAAKYAQAQEVFQTAMQGKQAALRGLTGMLPSLQRAQTEKPQIKEYVEQGPDGKLHRKRDIVNPATGAVLNSQDLGEAPPTNIGLMPGTDESGRPVINRINRGTGIASPVTTPTGQPVQPPPGYQVVYDAAGNAYWAEKPGFRAPGSGGAGALGATGPAGAQPIETPGGPAGKQANLQVVQAQTSLRDLLQTYSDMKELFRAGHGYRVNPGTHEIERISGTPEPVLVHGAGGGGVMVHPFAQGRFAQISSGLATKPSLTRGALSGLMPAAATHEELRAKTIPELLRPISGQSRAMASLMEQFQHFLPDWTVAPEAAEPAFQNADLMIERAQKELATAFPRSVAAGAAPSPQTHGVPRSTWNIMNPQQRQQAQTEGYQVVEGQ